MFGFYNFELPWVIDCVNKKKKLEYLFLQKRFIENALHTYAVQCTFNIEVKQKFV